MDDYSISSLQESRNEWCARLINIFTPLVIEGLKSIFDESWRLCEENDELEKYLMTYQNFLVRIPKWNSSIIETETNRIIEKSNCGYLTDLISCVHIIQLKSLTCMRVGNKQKKVDINIPTLSDFVHKIYINAARKIYTNIYLFEKYISPLQIQKHNRELELIVREQILNSIRENIPVESILKVYLDETLEDDIQVEESEEIISTEPIEEEETNNKENDNENDKENDKENDNENDKENDKENTNDNNIPSSSAKQSTPFEIDPLEPVNSQDNYSEFKTDTIKFNDVDNAIGIDNKIESISAPKNIERLEQISRDRNEARKIYEDDDDDDMENKIKIGEKINLTEMDIHDLEKPKHLNKVPIGLEEIEILA
jgi:hypothetical protein